MENKISLYLDFEYEINNVSFKYKNECDNSFQFMSTKLEEALKNLDDSISEKRLQSILSFLQNSEIELRECYFEILNMLDDY